MKKLLLFLFALALGATMFVQNSNAQVSTNGSSGLSLTYPSLAAAITALNVATITSSVVITLDAGNPQTAPAGGYAITATGVSGVTIAIHGSGNTITAFTPQASGNLNDAIFKIIGGDYITIDNFILQENAANTTSAVATNNMTEWGVALLYNTLTNGAQNNIIQGNTISLNRTYLNTFGIYSNTRHSATAVSTAAEVTAATGSNSFNKIYGNIISNVNYGIVFIGAGTTIAAIDNGNDIGGSIAGTGNSISNWGGGAATGGYISLTGNNYAIFDNQQINDNISFNTITSAALATAVTEGGILKNYSIASPVTGPITTTINNNTVTITNNPSAAATGGIVGINNQGLTPLLATATMSMNNNTVQNCVLGGTTSTTNGISCITNLSLPGTMNMNGNNVINNAITATTATTGIINGIANSGACGTLNITNNIIRGHASTSTSGQPQGITNSGVVVTAININNNQLGNATGGFFSTSTATSGGLFGISNSGGGAACALSIQTNDIRGITYNVAASATQTYITNSAIVLSEVISGNTFTNLNVNTTGATTFISETYSAIATATKTVTGNSIVTGFTRGGASGSVLLVTDNGSSAAGCVSTCTNNNFSNITVAGTSTIIGLNFTDGGTAPTRTVTGNVLNNWTAITGAVNAMNFSYWNGVSSLSSNTITNITGQAAITGITIGSSVNSATSIAIALNTINNLSSTGTGGTVIGINCSNTSTAINISGNVINTLSTTNTTGVVSGISIGGAANTSIFKNKIYDLSGNQAGSIINGINITSGSTLNIYNNLIGDLRATAATGLNAINGINASATSTYNVYYNSIYLNATSSSATTFGNSCMTFSSTATALNSRNNILVNLSTPGLNGTNVATNGIAACLRRSTGTTGTIPGNYSLTSNNNDFWCNPTSGTNNHLVYCEGTSTVTNPYNTMPALKAFFSTRDQASFAENPNFLGTTGSAANFLHISTLTATQLESGGGTIATVTTDYDGDYRFGDPSYVGTGTAPDVGADEFAGIPSDLTAPAITSITLVGNSCNLTSRNVTAIISDASGVDNASFKPRIYFRKNAIAYFSAPGTLTSGTVNSGTWTFTITYATLSGVTTTDVIDYFIVAQDALVNVGGVPAAGLVLSNVNTVTSPPTAPLTYSIQNALSGDYNVGSGQTYTTITAAIAAYNSSCMAGAVTFLLTDASYTEAAAMTINANADASPANILTIKPLLANTTIGVTGGSVTAVFILNGADYVTIDGSINNTVNACCSVPATRDLTITNANSGVTSAVIWLQTNVLDGATNNIIKNCNLVGNSNITTLFGAGSGSSSIGLSSLGTGNNNNAFINNNISKTQYGLYSQGASAAAKNSGNVFSLNLMNTATPNNVAKGGIVTGFENNLTISCNQVDGIVQTSSPDVFGITLGVQGISTSSFSGNEVTNATVAKNLIGSIRNTGTFSACGICVAPATTGNNLIANNMLSGVSANGTTGDFGVGIFIGGGSGSTTQVYYNTVTMVGTQTGGNDKSYCLAIGGSNPTVDVRNNILVNTQNNGTGSNYALAYGYTPFTNLTSSNNDLYVTADATHFIGATASISAPTNQATLLNLQTATGKDGASVNILPIFAGPADLRLVPATNTLLNDLGIPVSVTDDIECETRSATPDMGADEFTPPSCVTAVGGTASGSTSFCSSGTPAITATGYSIGLFSTYQWMYSTTIGDYPTGGSAFVGQTNPASLTTGVVSTTTYYWLRVGCTVNGNTTDNSTMVTITVNPSIAHISGTSVKCANDPAVTLTEDGGTGTSWVWSTTATTQSVSVNPAVSTVYSVSVTSPGSCIAVGTFALTVNPNPPGVTASASASPLCAGTPFNLTSTATSANPTILSEGFESGASGWVFEDSLSTGSSIAGQIFHIQAAPYTDASGSATFSNFSITGSKFAYANADAGGSGSFTRTKMYSPSFSTVGFTGSGTLTFNHVYRYWASSAPPEKVRVSISIDGGASWADLQSYEGLDRGTVTNNLQVAAPTSITVPAIYMGQPNVKLRWRYISNWGYFWCLDDILLTGTPASYTFGWTSTPPGFTSSDQNPTNVTQTVTRDYHVTVTGLGGCTSLASATVVNNPLPTPSISGSLIICAGSSNTLDAGAYAGYHWSTDATTRTISVSTASTYAVTVTDVNGCVGSTSVVTSVHPLPEINLATGGTSSICPGTGTNITVEGSIIGTNYQLRNDADNSPVGLPVGGDGGTINLPTGNLAVTTTFNVLATIASTGCSAQLTGKVTIIVGGPITTISNRIVCEGTATVDVPVRVSSFDNVGSLSLTFGYNNAELTNPVIVSRNAAFEGFWDPFEVTTTPAGTFKVSGFGPLPGDGVTIGPNDILFTLQFNIVSGTTYSPITLNENVQGTACEYTSIAPDFTPFCDTPPSTYYIAGSVTVNPLGHVNDPADQVVCNGELTADVIFTSSKGPALTSYTWTNTNTTIGLAASGSADIPAFTAINTGTSPAIATIEVTPTYNNGGVGCVGPSQTFTITVNPTGQVIDPADQVVCNGASTGAVSFATNNSDGITTYSWTNDTPQIGLSGTGTGDIDSFTAINTGTSPVVATITVTPYFENGSVSCIGPFETFTITVNPTGQVNTPADQVVCNGGLTTDVDFISNNGGGSVTYAWTNDTPGIGLDASGSGNIPAFTASNTGTAPVVASIAVTPTFTNSGVSCSGTPVTFTINVNPTGQVNDPSNQVVCNGTTTALVTFGSVNTGGTTTYTWDNTTTSIGLAGSGIGNIAGFIASNTTTAPVSATITVTPHFENGQVICDGPTESFDITVNPSGQVNDPANQVVCNGANTSVTFGTNNTGGTTSYTWANTTTSIGLGASGSGDISSFMATNTTTTPVIATITVTPFFENGLVTCSGPTENFTITVNPSGQVNDPADQVVCNGASTGSVTFGTNNLGGTTTYTWSNSASGIGLAASGTGDIASFTAVNTTFMPVVATITVTPHFENGSVTCDGTVQTFTIAVNPTGQVNDPIDQDLCNGATTSVVFGTLNSGGTTTYTWVNNTTSIGLGAAGTGNIPAFAATNTTTAPVVATIVVTPHFENGGVTCDGLSKSFTITVNPTGQVDDPANQVVCNGANTTVVNFSTINTGGTTTYAWSNNKPGIGLASTGTGDIAAFSAINASTAPVIATITVTPHFGDCSGPAESFTITVNPTGQVNQPTSQVVCNGTNTSVTFGTINTGGYTTYFWTNTTTSIGLGTFGIGDIGVFAASNTGTSPVVAVINVTPTFTNDGVSCSGPTKAFTITVNPTGQVNQPGNQLVCNGAATAVVTFTTINTGGNTTYVWSNNTPGINLTANGTGNIPSFTAVNTGTAPVVATITVTPAFEKKSVSCVGTSKTFTITVNPSGQVNQPGNQIVCNGTSSGAVTFGTNNTGGTTTYTWANSNTTVGLGANGTGDIAAFMTSNTGTAPAVSTITVTPHFENGSVTCDGPPAIFTITVNPTGQVNQPASQVVCNAGSTSDVIFATANTGGTTSYTWSNSLPAIGLAALGTGDIASFTALNATTAPVVATITVIPHFENGEVICDGTEKTFTITVNPTGQVNFTADQLVCNGTSTAAVTFTTNNTVGTTTYAWANDTPSIGLASTGTGNIASFTAVNTGTAPVVATIGVTPTFTYGGKSCTGPEAFFTITVNPTGQVIQPANQVVCNGSTTSVTFGTNNTGGTTTYAWSNNTTSIGLAANGAGNIAPFNAVNTGTSPVTATIVVTPTFYIEGFVKDLLVPCTGPSATFTITVNPTGQVNQPANQVLSNGSSTTAVTFGTVNTGGTTTYAWTNNDASIGLGSTGTGNIAAFTAINTGVSPVVATIFVTPTFTNGGVSCTGTGKSFTITVNPKPILVITNPSTCSPHKVDLTAPSVTAGSSYPPTTILTYWYDAAATNQILVPTAVGNGTYYIKATIPPGGWYDIKPVVATVHPLPTIFAGTGSGNYCGNLPSVVVGLAGSQLGVVYTLWIGITQVSPSPVPGNGGPISFGSIPLLTGQYWVLAENATTHCQNRMYNCIYITIDPVLPVSVTITASANPVAADIDVTFTAVAVNGGLTPSYQWKVNTFNVGVNSPTYTYKPINGDHVTCVVTSSASCVSNNPAISNLIHMNVTGLHVGSITVNGIVPGAESACYNSLATITVAGSGTTFIVNNGGSATMIAGQNIIYLPGTTVQAGGYMHGYISLTDRCGVKSASIVAAGTGEDEQLLVGQKTSFRIYPNPTTGNFTVEQTSGSQYETVKVEIYGMRGEKLLTGQLTGEKKHEFSVTGFPAGLYFVKIVAGNEAETLKLIKTN
ncbi:MAG: T9SS type A sorting domain-containing protein [Bacteroidetes bacterium]|nr:T9SS type A sorting domain-containing protein [Bacteroidota bacterium]